MDKNLDDAKLSTIFNSLNVFLIFSPRMFGFSSSNFVSVSKEMVKISFKFISMIKIYNNFSTTKHTKINYLPIFKIKNYLKLSNVIDTKMYRITETFIFTINCV